MELSKEIKERLIDYGIRVAMGLSKKHPDWSDEKVDEVTEVVVQRLQNQLIKEEAK